MSMNELAEKLLPLAAKLKGIALTEPTVARKEVEASLPFGGDVIRDVRTLVESGVAAGWLLPRESGDIRFGRVAKDLDGFTVDAVLMSSPGPRHRHPNGEIDLCFTRRGDAKFDGHSEGWVVYPPGSTHVPTVTDGEMVILYFLPGGAIEFI